MKSIYQSVILFVVMTIISGVIYPLGVTALGQLFWPKKSNGSLIKEGDMIIGSELIAQKFIRPSYFWPRPSAGNFNAVPSLASNLGPTSKELASQIKERRESLAKIHGVMPKDIPMDLLTTSGSGLDPHISIESARLQVARIAHARGLENSTPIMRLIEKHAQAKDFTTAKKSLVNVLLINIDLDRCCRHD